MKEERSFTGAVILEAVVRPLSFAAADGDFMLIVSFFFFKASDSPSSSELSSAVLFKLRPTSPSLDNPDKVQTLSKVRLCVLLTFPVATTT